MINNILFKFFAFFKTNKNKPETEKNSLNQMEDIELKTKIQEEDEMESANVKKKYIYGALDENGKAILDRNGQLIISDIIEENASIDWSEIEKKYNIKIKIKRDIAFSVEVTELHKGMRKKIMENARKKLLERAKVLNILEQQTQKTEMQSERNDTEMSNDITQRNADSTDEIQSEKFGKSNESTQQIVDTKAVISAVKSVETRINENINTAVYNINEANNKNMTIGIQKVEDTLKTIEGNSKNMTISIQKVEDTLKTIEGNSKNMITSVPKNIQKTVESQVKTSDERTKKYIDDVICHTSKSVTESQDKLISKISTVGKRMGELGESVESIEGELHKLDQLDEIAELFRNKGLNISMEIPPVNADEEDIVNLVRYSQKITEQLGYAARDLIRKQETFRSQAESNENEQRMMDQKIDKARSDGINEGKKLVIKQLLAKYEDIDSIKESKDNYVHVIWNLLMEIGVVIDGEGYYEKGKEIELSSEDIDKMMATYSGLETPGKYKVARTGLSMYGEIISTAYFEKVTDESVDDRKNKKADNEAKEEEKNEKEE